MICQEKRQIWVKVGGNKNSICRASKMANLLSWGWDYYTLQLQSCQVLYQSGNVL